MSDLNKYDFVVSNFVQVEEQLINCLNYIPFIEENKAVISPKFIPIIMESCGLIDSVFKELSNSNNDRLTFKKYYELHNERLDLENNKSLFLISPLKVLNPFQDWGNIQPVWWQAYNNLKHNRLDNYHFANYTNAILSLCGLHQLIARCKMFLGSIIRYGWIDFTDTEMPEQISSVIGLGSLMNNPPDIAVESKLFLSSAVEDLFDFVNDENEFELNYDIPGISSRVRYLMSANDI